MSASSAFGAGRRTPRRLRTSRYDEVADPSHLIVGFLLHACCRQYCLRRDITSAMQSKEVRTLTPSDHLTEVIHCDLGSRGKRYESANEPSEALRRQRKEPTRGRVRDLRGKRVSFTGLIYCPRNEAIAAARKAGKTVHSNPSQATNVLVRGRPNARQFAGSLIRTLCNCRCRCNLGEWANPPSSRTGSPFEPRT